MHRSAEQAQATNLTGADIMQAKQTNSTLTFLRAEYRAILRSAYARGLAATTLAAVAVPAAAAVPDFGTTPDGAVPSKDNSALDFSADNLDFNIGAHNAAALTPANYRTLPLAHGASLSFSTEQPAPVAVAAATGAATTAADRAAVSAVPASDTTPATAEIHRREAADPDTDTWEIPLRDYSGAVDNSRSLAKLSAQPGRTLNMRVLATAPLSAGETQYYYAKDSADIPDFINRGTINFYQEERPYNANVRQNPVVIAQGEATPYDITTLSGGTVLINAAGSEINLSGAEGLDNVGMLITAGSSPDEWTPVQGMARNDGTINVTNGTAIKVVGNGYSRIDHSPNRYIGFNRGTINVTADVQGTGATDTGAAGTGAVGMGATGSTGHTEYSVEGTSLKFDGEELAAAGLRFSGPTTSYAYRVLQNSHEINVHNSSTVSSVVAAGIAIDGGADHVVARNQGTITAIEPGTYAILVGNDSAGGVQDFSTGNIVSMNEKSQVDGIVKLAHSTRLNVFDHKDGFVLKSFAEKAAAGSPAEAETGLRTGIDLILGNADLTLESGSDVTTTIFKEYHNDKGSSLTIADGATFSLGRETDPDVSSGTEPVTLSKTALINDGEFNLTDQSLTTSGNIRNTGTFNVKDGARLEIHDANFSNWRGELNLTNKSQLIAVNPGSFLNAADAAIKVDDSALTIVAPQQDWSNDGTINLGNSGSFTVTTGTTVVSPEGTGDGAAAFAGADGSKLANNGTIKVSGQSRLNFTGSSSAPLKFINNSNGSISLADSTLTIDGTVENRGQINAVSGSNVNIDLSTVTSSAAAADMGAGFTNTLNGVVTANASNITIKGARHFNNRGQIDLTSGANLTATAANPETSVGSSTAPYAFYNEGRVTATGTTTRFTLNAAKNVNNGTMELTSGALTQFNGTDATGSEVINNTTGTMSLEASRAELTGSLENRGQLLVGNGSTFIIAGGPTAGDTSGLEASGNLINTTNGKIELTDGSSLTVDQGQQLQNTGTINVSSARFDFIGTNPDSSAGGAADAGAADAAGTAAGSAMSNSGTMSFTQGSGQVFTQTAQNTGTIKVTDGSRLNFSNHNALNGTMPWESSNSRFINNGTVEIDNSALRIAHNELFNNGSGDMAVNNGGNLEVAANSVYNRGEIAADNNSRLDFTINQGFNNSSNITLTSDSTLKLLSSNESSPATFTNSNGAQVSLSSGAQADFATSVTNSGNISLTQAQTTFTKGKVINTGSGQITLADNSRIEITSDTFRNDGTINSTDSTIAFNVGSIEGHQLSVDQLMALVGLDKLGKVTATNTTLELLNPNELNRTTPAPFADQTLASSDGTGADADAALKLAVLTLDKAEDLDTRFNGTGNKIKLNNQTAVTIASDTQLTNDYFKRFSADAPDTTASTGGTAGGTGGLNPPLSAEEQIASRNLYLKSPVTFTADGSGQIITAQNLTINFTKLELKPDADSSGSLQLTGGSHVAVSEALTMTQNTDTLQINSGSVLTFDTGRLAPTAGGSTPAPTPANGTIAASLELNGADAHVVFASAPSGSSNIWEVTSGHKIQVNSGLMELNQGAVLTADTVNTGADGVVYTQYGSELKIRGDNDQSTTNFENQGIVVNHGTLNLGLGGDTIGVAFDAGSGRYTSKMGNGIDGGGHIVIDLSDISHTGANWNALNDFAWELSQNHGNVEIKGVTNLRLPSSQDPDTGFNTINKEDVDDIISAVGPDGSGGSITYPDAVLSFETKQTKNAVLTGLDNDTDKLFGGGWRGLKAKSGATVIGALTGTHTNIYDVADKKGNIAVDSEGKLIGLDLESGATVNLLGNGKIGAITGSGTLQLTGDGNGITANVEIKNTDDTWADLNSGKLVALNKSSVTAHNITTTADIQGSRVTAHGVIDFQEGSQLKYATVSGDNNVTIAANSTTDHSTVTAAQDLALGDNNTITYSELNATNNLILGTGTTTTETTLNAGNEIIGQGSTFAHSIITAPNITFTGNNTLTNGSSLDLSDILQLGSANDQSAVTTATGDTQITAAQILLNPGATFNIGGSDTGAKPATATVHTKELNSAANSTLNLNPGAGIRAALFNAEKLTNNTLKGKVNIGNNAVFSTGFNSAQAVRDLLAGGTTPLVDGKGALKSEHGAILALNQAISIDSAARITIDGAASTSDTRAKAPAALALRSVRSAPWARAADGTLNLKNSGTLLLTDQAFADGGAAITFTGGTKGSVTSDQGAIYLAGNFTGSTTYHLFEQGDLSAATDLKVVSANGKISGTVGADGDFVLGFVKTAAATAPGADNGIENGTDAVDGSAGIGGTGTGGAAGGTGDVGGNAGAGGSPGGYSRIYQHASVPVDRMLQDVFNSGMQGQGADFLRTVATTGMGDGIEAERAARLGTYAGATHAVITTADAFNNALTNREQATALEQDILSVGNAVKDMGSSRLWVSPLYQRQSAEKLQSEGISYGADVDVSGALLGLEHSFVPGFAVGLAAGAGTGSADGSDSGKGPTTDFDWYGAGLYTSVHYGAFRLGADVSYTEVSSDFEGDSGLTGYGKLNSSTKDRVISAGLNTAWRFNAGAFEILPHAGLRYTSFDFDSYQVKSGKNELASIEQDNMDVFSLPFGVGIATTFTGDGWSITPQLDLMAAANFGDTDLNLTSKFGDYNAHLQSEVLDDFTYGAALGLKATAGDFTFGAKVSYTGSDTTDSLNATLDLNYRF